MSFVLLFILPFEPFRFANGRTEHGEAGRNQADGQGNNEGNQAALPLREIEPTVEQQTDDGDPERAQRRNEQRNDDNDQGNDQARKNPTHDFSPEQYILIAAADMQNGTFPIVPYATCIVCEVTTLNLRQAESNRENPDRSAQERYLPNQAAMMRPAYSAFSRSSRR